MMHGENEKKSFNEIKSLLFLFSTITTCTPVNELLLILQKELNGPYRDVQITIMEKTK